MAHNCIELPIQANKEGTIGGSAEEEMVANLINGTSPTINTNKITVPILHEEQHIPPNQQQQQQRDSRDRSHKRLCHHRQDCKMESPAWRTTASNYPFKQTRRAPLVAAQRKKWWLISSTAPAPPSTPTRSLSPYYMKNNISLQTNNNRLGYKAGEQEQRPQPIIMR